MRPREDIDIVNLELSLADLATVEKIIERNRRPAATGEREARAIVAVAEKIGAALAQGLPARAVELNEREAERARAFFLLTAKPVLYVANVDEGGFGDNPLAAEVAAIARADGAPLVPVCARLEAEIADMSDSEKLEFLRDLGLAETGLGRLARAAHEMLGLSVFFTAGRKEARAWTFRRGICAREAAGVIHTDFAKKFIRAEVAGWEEYLRCGGETGAREAGKMRLEGADYIVRGRRCDSFPRRRLARRSIAPSGQRFANRGDSDRSRAHRRHLPGRSPIIEIAIAPSGERERHPRRGRGLLVARVVARV